MQDIGPVADSSLYLLWCGSVVSETGVQYLCTRELPHVCAVSCVAQYGSILGYSSQDFSRGEESECSSAWITSWLAVWLIFLLKYFPQERLWNVTAKWVQEASSCNKCCTPPLCHWRKWFIFLPSLFLPLLLVCWLIFFPVDFSVQSTTLFLRADLGPFLCKRELFKRQDWKCNCGVAFCILSKKGRCYCKPVSMDFHELKESCVTDSVRE